MEQAKARVKDEETDLSALIIEGEEQKLEDE